MAAVTVSTRPEVVTTCQFVVAGSPLGSVIAMRPSCQLRNHAPESPPDQGASALATARRLESQIEGPAGAIPECLTMMSAIGTFTRVTTQRAAPSWCAQG